MTSIGLVILGYLSGSVPYGILVGKWLGGVDVRSAGSGNIGATNVARVAGKKLGLLVLLLDALKGAVPAWISLTVSEVPAVHAAVGLAAFLGHVFPIWLRFKGGKGVATAFGVLTVLAPRSAFAGFCTYALLLALFRVSSIGSLFGGVATLTTAILNRRQTEYIALIVGLFLLMLFTHRGNIQRLLKHTERHV